MRPLPTHRATAPTRSIKALRPCYFDLTLIHRVHNKCKYSNLALMHYHYFCHIFLPSPTPVSIISNVLYYIVLLSSLAIVSRIGVVLFIFIIVFGR